MRQPIQENMIMTSRRKVLILVQSALFSSCTGFLILPKSSANGFTAYWKDPNGFTHRNEDPNKFVTRNFPTAVYSKPPSLKHDEDDAKIQLPSPYTLLIDSLAILLAVEFVGLLNEVNDVDFVRNGGWFQPLPSIQEQTMSLSKVLSGWILNIASWTTSLTIVPLLVDKTWNTPEANPWRARFVPAMVCFAIIRCFCPVITDYFMACGIAWESALLDIYLVALALGTTRYLLGNE